MNWDMVDIEASKPSWIWVILVHPIWSFLGPEFQASTVQKGDGTTLPDPQTKTHCCWEQSRQVPFFSPFWDTVKSKQPWTRGLFILNIPKVAQATWHSRFRTKDTLWPWENSKMPPGSSDNFFQGRGQGGQGTLLIGQLVIDPTPIQHNWYLSSAQSAMAYHGIPWYVAIDSAKWSCKWNMCIWNYKFWPKSFHVSMPFSGMKSAMYVNVLNSTNCSKHTFCHVDFAILELYTL